MFKDYKPLEFYNNTPEKKASGVGRKMSKPLKKKVDDSFSEFYFEPPEGEKPPEAPKTPEPTSITGRPPVQFKPPEAPKEQTVGVNPLTQKPIIKGIEKKPFINDIKETPIVQQKPISELTEDDFKEEEAIVNELQQRAAKDITPVSNSPEVKPRELNRELTREEAAAKAREIWEEKEKKKPLLKKFFGGFFK